jgi:hypothetical protein
MQLSYVIRRGALAGLLVLATAGIASANLLTNADMEAGPTGGGVQSWITFGNVFTEAPPAAGIQPLSGNQVAKMFGTFSGNYGVSGMFQEFPATPGSVWQLSSNALHAAVDPMIGAGPAASNWVVQKIAFKDAGDAEIGAVESVILDGTFSQDTWHAAAPIVGNAPAGTVQIEAFILYVQPNFDGGSAQIDDVELLDISPVPTEPTTWSRIKNLSR